MRETAGVCVSETVSRARARHGGVKVVAAACRCCGGLLRLLRRRRLRSLQEGARSATARREPASQQASEPASQASLAGEPDPPWNRAREDARRLFRQSEEPVRRRGAMGAGPGNLIISGLYVSLSLSVGLSVSRQRRL